MRKRSGNAGASASSRRRSVCATVLGAAFVSLMPLSGAAESGQDAGQQGTGPEPLKALVGRLRKEEKLVGLAAMVMIDGKVVASAADGERKIGSRVPVRLGDRWHVGSITKSMTATMIARLVEAGKLQWTDTISTHFRDATIHEDWKPVTLRQLLTHTSGAPSNFSTEVKRNRPAPGPESTRERRKAVLEVIAEQPASPPGEKRVYSNVGYTIAGAMAEQATGLGWEDLMKREVFRPLKLNTAGFGPPKSSVRKPDQPQGHHVVDGRKVSSDIDNTPIIGPAGTVHMSLPDLCVYATAHLRGELGSGTLLTTETFQRLHTPELDNYACGWGVKRPSHAIPHTTYWHNGSNTLWYALVVFVPAKNMVVAVAANDGDVDLAEPAAWEIVEACANRFETGQDAELRKSHPRLDFAKKSPFAAIRWNNAQPEVMVGEEWFQLVSIDGLLASDIVTFCRSTYAQLWRKRFEEDLVEVLYRMGHEPNASVRLVVRPVESMEERTLDDVAMTAENRRAIRNAASDR